jgi:hypothetical protein
MHVGVDQTGDDARRIEHQRAGRDCRAGVGDRRDPSMLYEENAVSLWLRSDGSYLKIAN